RLQVAPAVELERYRREQKELLETYGWVSKKEGIVRIPIARAMELIAKEGLPSRMTNANSSLQTPPSPQPSPAEREKEKTPRGPSGVQSANIFGGLSPGGRK